MSQQELSDLKEAYTTFTHALATAKKHKIQHFSPVKILSYQKYYKNLVAKQKDYGFDNDFNLLEKIQNHTALIYNLIKLYDAMRDPKNEPRVDTKNILVSPKRLFQSAQVKQLSHARAKAKEFIPLVKKLFAQACLAQKYNLNYNAVDESTLKFLSNAVECVTKLVEDKTKNPQLVEKALSLSREVIISKKIRKMCLSNPRLVSFSACLTMIVAAALTLVGVLACVAGAGAVGGIPLITAGVGLFFVGKKINNTLDYYRFNKKHDKRDLVYAKFGVALEKVAHTKATVDAYKDAHKTLKKVQPFFDDSASQALYPQPRKSI